MVKFELPKLASRVRFPSPAPKKEHITLKKCAMLFSCSTVFFVSLSLIKGAYQCAALK